MASTVASGNGLSFDELKEMLKCIVCQKMVSPPIQQCISGHLICCDCKPRYYACPDCSCRYGNIRNLFAERAAENIQVPCKYQSSGCQEQLTFKVKTDHESLCSYRPISCPFHGCDKKCPGSFLLSHIHIAHECEQSVGDMHSGFLVIKDEDFTMEKMWNLKKILFEDKVFFLQCFRKSSGFFNMWLSMFGSKTESERFCCEIVVYRGNTEFCYKGQVRPLYIPERDTVCTELCLIFQDSTAKLLRQCIDEKYGIFYRLKLLKRAQSDA